MNLLLELEEEPQKNSDRKNFLLSLVQHTTLEETTSQEDLVKSTTILGNT